MTKSNSDDVFEGKSFGELAIEGLAEVAEALQSDKRSVPHKFTCHKVSLQLAPTPYNAALVKRTRELLAASQAVFAQFLGVSVSTVRAWEQGVNVPQDSACRLMDEIRHDPAHWRRRMEELLVQKTSRAKGSAAAPR